MKKSIKTICLLVAAVGMCSSLFAAKKSKDVTINLWTFTDEVPGMIEKYIATHPDCGIKLNTTIIATTEGAYQPALNIINLRIKNCFFDLQSTYLLS